MEETGGNGSRQRQRNAIDPLRPRRRQHWGLEPAATMIHHIDIPVKLGCGRVDCVQTEIACVPT